MYKQIVSTLKTALNNNSSKYQSVDITIGNYKDLSFNKNINPIFFEKILKKLKSSIPDEDINYRNYVLYEYEDNNSNKQLLVFSNGSSVSHRLELVKTDIINSKEIDFMYNITNKFKIENDSFEPRFNYDLIEETDGVQFKYNNIEIELLEINSCKKIINIKCNNKNINKLNEVLKILFD